MEFGIFIQGYVPGPSAHDPEAEHRSLMQELELIECADANNWKYVWVTEHHALPEYSHISANEVFLANAAARTERIHLGSGIFNLSPRVNHPVKTAEKTAMLDHLTEGRFEFGTGRGAGSHEVATFNIHDTSSTRAEWDEVVWEIPRMWERKDYTFQGEHFAIDTPHNILPKPYGGKPGHPPLWVACGSPSTYGKAGSLGIGALGFNFSPIADMQPQIDAYKEGAADCTDPIGQFQNDNVMITNAVRCSEDRARTHDQALRPDSGYLFSLVCLYHDTFPKPEGAPTWPEPPTQMDPDMLQPAIDGGFLLCGTPEEVSEQLERTYMGRSIDQLVFGVPGNFTHEEALDMLETFGQKVIPEFDKDPEHSTDRYRATAEPKFGPFEHEPPEITTIFDN